MISVERGKFGLLSKEKTIEVVNILGEMFPDAHCELNYTTTFQLLIAVILSAQTTDVSVNKVTPALFLKYPTPEKMADAPVDDLMNLIKTIGLYRNKSKNIKACATMLMEKYHGEVPKTREELVALPGVGRKTANVVMGEGFGIPAIAVDTHVERVTKRLRIVKQNASVLEVEQTLMKKLPSELWTVGHHRFVLFGRYHCTARAPKCDTCPVLMDCQEGKSRLGVKA